jgi:wyosine [tRNA(Phe)-imidazoG37] synthetase (radical SAM superfamily)
MRLTTRIHDRDNAGLTYVYPVVSRRAGGVSVGVNLNPNNACNWRCVYCQVPGLVYGKAPEIDVALLRDELDGMLEAIVRGDYMERCVPEGARRLNDIAFSGNGEPTGSPRLEEAVGVAADALARFGLAGDVGLVLITNGSLVRKPDVRRALERLGAAGGEAWFKLDRATDAGMEAVNSSTLGAERQLENLAACARACPTWIQTCVFARGGEAPGAEELDAYVGALERLVRDRVPLRGVLLYGLERASHQPEAPELSKLSSEWLEALGARIAATGLTVRVHP